MRHSGTRFVACGPSCACAEILSQMMMLARANEHANEEVDIATVFETQPPFDDTLAVTAIDDASVLKDLDLDDPLPTGGLVLFGRRPLGDSDRDPDVDSVIQKLEELFDDGVLKVVIDDPVDIGEGEEIRRHRDRDKVTTDLRVMGGGGTGNGSPRKRGRAPTLAGVTSPDIGALASAA